MEQTQPERRFLAYIIDYGIALAIALTLVTIYSFSWSASVFYYFYMLALVTAAILFIYYFLFYLFTGGLSIGKMIFNIRAISIKDRRLNFYQSFMRAALQSLLPIAFLNMLYQLFWHSQASFFDRATDTKIVYWHS